MSWFDDFSTFAINNSKQFDVGLNFLSAGFKYSSDKQNADTKQAWQKYSNAMTNISNAMNQNVVTVNQEQAIQASVQQSANIQEGSIFAQAKAEVAAAAAGVGGRSVTQAQVDIQANAASREAERVKTLNQTLQGFDQQRKTSEFTAQSNQDYSYIPKPSIATALFGAGMSSLNFLSGIKA